MTEDSIKLDSETAPKRIGFLLGAGIVILPFVFAWFTLRKGYGRVARFVSLGWLGLVMAMLVSSMLSSAAESKRLAELEVAAKSRGFDGAYEMETLQKQGFKTKAEFLAFVAKTPISPPDAEYAAQCYALALVWNEHALDEKAGQASTAPTDLTDGLNSIISDYTSGIDAQSVEHVNARQDYYKIQFEKAYTSEGSQALVRQYATCKENLGQLVIAKQKQAAEQARIDANANTEESNSGDKEKIAKAARALDSSNIQIEGEKQSFVDDGNFKNLLFRYHDEMLGIDRVILTWSKVRDLCHINNTASISDFTHSQYQCYENVKKAAVSECYALIEAAQADCAKAGDPGFCMKTLHKTEDAMNWTSRCVGLSPE